MGYFSFQMQSAWEGRNETIAVLYRHRDGAFSNPLDDTVEKLTNRRLPPSRLIIVAPQYAAKEVEDEFKNLSHLSRERLRVTHQVLLIEYGCDGRLFSAKVLFNSDGSSWLPNDEDLVKIAYEGVQQLVKESGTLLKAPAGYYFRKPSQNVSDTFIRAGNMFKDPAALSLVHHLLLRVVPPQTKQIYIDSVTILPIALYFRAECLKLAETCGGLFGDPTIINFHSYDIDSNLRFPGHNEYFVLISASSSGGLLRELVETHGAAPEKIRHLLGISHKSELEKTSLYFEKCEVPAKLEKGTLKEINIPSEEFVASHGDARPVKITKAHVSRHDKRVYSDSQLQKGLEVRLAGTYDESSGPIGISEGDCMPTDQFSDWLKNELSIAVPNNVAYIVTTGTRRVVDLAITAKTHLDEQLRNPITIVPLDALIDGSAKLSPRQNCSILVLCDEEGPGDRLLAASRALREYRNVHRHYLVCYCYPESRALYERLKNNLTTSGSGRNYGWSSYHWAAIGAKRLHTSWQAEVPLLAPDIVDQIAPKAPRLLDALRARAALLHGKSLKTSDVFLPNFRGTPLTLQPDSIFYLKDAKEISQVTVYLTITSVLQRARDGRDADDHPLEDQHCFDNNPFIDTVLDPDMFSRFNDGVIQAAFLRASSVDELNYARSVTLSRQMSAIIKSILIGRHNSNGEAAVEFIFAITRNKLRLDSADLTRLREFIDQEPEVKSVWDLFSRTPAF